MPTQYEPGAKVIIGGQVIIDLSGDDVTAADVASGKKFHTRDGSSGVGTNTNDTDTSEATALSGEILNGKTAGVRGEMIAGSMPNRGAVSAQLATKSESYVIPEGYHDGSGRISIDATEQAKLIPDNIREGITVLGVEGSMSGSEDVVAAAANVTPSLSAQTIIPSDLGTGVNSISQVNVAAIPVVITENPTGGKTYAIG